MKYITVFLILNLLLSPFSGMANIMSHRAAVVSCKENMHKDIRQNQRHSENNDCTNNSCHAMLSCGICGFIKAPAGFLSPAMVDLNVQVTYPFITGELSDYQDNNWIPPKA
jgi:hypothetical protein